MKKCILLGLGVFAGASLFVSCSEHTILNLTGGNGQIVPNVEIDTETVTSRSTDPASRAQSSRATEVTASDLSLRLTKADGSESWEWATVAEFPTEKAFGVGDYNLDAFYGDVNEQGFDCPSYFGTQAITVYDGKTTTPSLVATMSKSMFTIKYTEAFEGYMKDWNATVSGVDYTRGETRPVYVTPGDVEIKIEVTKPNGLGATFTLDKVAAKPRYHYTLTVDVNNGEVGDAELKITFDDNLDQEEIFIDLSDKVLSTPAPKLTPKGYEDGVELNFIAGMAPDNDLSLSIVALAGLKEVKMTTSSASLIKQGWPAEIDLMTADASMQATLTSLGLNVVGLWKTPGEMAVVTFSDVIKQLTTIVGDDNATTISVTAKDKLMRESDPVALCIGLEEVNLELSPVGQYFEPGAELELNLGYNGQDVRNNVSIQYKNPVSGTWRNLAYTNVSEGKSRSMADYTVTVIAPDVDKELVLRAKCNNTLSNEITVTLPPFAVEALDYNVYATHAYVSVVSTDGSAAPSADTWSFFVKKDGETDFKSVQHTLVDGLAHITGLSANSNYSIKVRSNGLGSGLTAFRTENAADVPNGDFEQLGREITAVSENQGGLWSVSSGVNYQNYVNFSINEAAGWATTNAKTLNGKSALVAADNTWFNQPSVFNTTLTYSSTVPPIRVLGTGGGTETPAAYKGFTAHSGDNAMVIRNVGWDPAGTVPAVKVQLFAPTSDYYNKTAPAVANNSVGKMFLGTYTWSGSSETYNQGVDFTSRPSALTGWYTYTNAGNDNGVVTVEVLNGNTVIASGTANLNAAGSYTQFTVPLEYAANAPKATSVRIMVASSKHASTDMASETANVAVTAYNSRYESYMHGATLVVDDFKFVY